MDPAVGDRVEVLRASGSWQPATVTAVTGSTGPDGVWVGAVMAQWGKLQKAVPVPSPFIRAASGLQSTSSVGSQYSEPTESFAAEDDESVIPEAEEKNPSAAVVPLREHLETAKRLQAAEEELRVLRELQQQQQQQQIVPPQSSGAQRTRPTVGDAVRLAPGRHGGECMRHGEVGTIVRDDRDDQPYQVTGPRGESCWCAESDVVFASEVQPVGSVAVRVNDFAEGDEVEVSGFSGDRKAYNGIRGTVISARGDGRVLVRFALLGGTTLAMQPSSLRLRPFPGPAESRYPLGQIVAAGGQNGTRGRVVGYRGALLLCEFAKARPGVFPVRPEDVVPVGEKAHRTHPRRRTRRGLQLHERSPSPPKWSPVRVAPYVQQTLSPTHYRVEALELQRRQGFPKHAATHRPSQTQQPMPPQPQRAAADTISEQSSLPSFGLGVRGQIDISTDSPPPATRVVASPNSNGEPTGMGQPGVFRVKELPGMLR
eukprot:TRINITY_DN2372_c0_g1_i1.p1 TRINITY_DN2372_c0_g1~~TRINITY_DN2372_c0_g1_i1.p1  ORF type:complete len:484 (+),score=41.60 TRINITY_DN2372_c0_g1_i1:87-1538(+)